MMVYNCVLMLHSGLCRFTTHHWLTMWQTLDLLTFHDLFVILRRFLKANRFNFSRISRKTWERTYLRLKTQRNSPCRITRSLSFWSQRCCESISYGDHWPLVESDPGCFWWLKAIQRNDEVSTMKSHKYPEITEKSQEKHPFYSEVLRKTNCSIS